MALIRWTQNGPSKASRTIPIKQTIISTMRISAAPKCRNRFLTHPKIRTLSSNNRVPRTKTNTSCQMISMTVALLKWRIKAIALRDSIVSWSNYKKLRKVYLMNTKLKGFTNSGPEPKATRQRVRVKAQCARNRAPGADTRFLHLNSRRRSLRKWLKDTLLLRWPKDTKSVLTMSAGGWIDAKELQGLGVKLVIW